LLLVVTLTRWLSVAAAVALVALAVVVAQVGIYMRRAFIFRRLLTP
tara:strand:- start:593 stop:730 length:138 start_codon:yes stop_codon:yes gene_type:complete